MNIESKFKNLVMEINTPFQFPELFGFLNQIIWLLKKEEIWSSLFLF